MSSLTLKKFSSFESSANALNEVSEVIDGKVPPMLQNLLGEIKGKSKVSLAVADPKLATAIKKLPGFSISAVSDSSTAEIYRGIRACLCELIPELLPENVKTMSLGLSHSLSRHKFRLSPDKLDVMVIHAVYLLDEIDKEQNIKSMRLKEWYGWHFPELFKIIGDNMTYARFIAKVGMRQNTRDADLASILPEELETATKAAAEVSMGMDIMEEDLENIVSIAHSVIQLSEYRAQLASYLDSRMKAIAPNLTELVGALTGAKIIAKTGSLVNLAKTPSSTIQILGAEKALFRALKTKHDTPKYGIIYHASLVGQATGRNKGKIARMLAAKVGITSRTDALSTWGARGEGEPDEVDEETKTKLGVKSRLKVEKRLHTLEGRLILKGSTVAPVNANKFEVKKTKQYNEAADGVDGSAVNGHHVDIANGEEALDEGMADAHQKSLEEISETDKKEKKRKKSKREEESGETKSQAKPLTETQYEKYAEEAGISVSKFKRKYQRGDFEVGEDGTPRVLSKKELKKRKKEEASGPPKAEEELAKTKKKRKHESDDETKPKKKKKSKHG